MNDSHQNHDPATLADLHDRLMDHALTEVIGGEAPPDLTAKILDQVVAHKSEPATTSRKSLNAIGWSVLTLAASISIVAATVYLFSFSGRATNRSSSARVQRTSAAESTPPGEEPIGLRGQISDGTRQVGDGSGVKHVPLTSTHVRLLKGAPANQPPLEIPFQQNSLSDRSALQGQRFRIEQAPGDIVQRYVPSFQDAEGTTFGFRRRKFAGTDLDASRPGLQVGVTPRIIIEEQEERLGILVETGKATNLGTGPGSPGDQYTRIIENPFVKAIGGDAVSTFSIDVDTASYANVRQFLMDMRQLPPPDAVRIEELVNYFEYGYQPPTPPAPGSAGGNVADPAPFAAHVEIASCPWAPDHRLVRIGIKGREVARDKRPKSNLVFLVDVSGSMDEPNKLPLVVDGLRQLTRELGENDRVTIVVYASSEGLALESTRGDQQQTILAALDRLQAGGSTAGGAGIQLAYQIAEDHFILGGTNRVVLCTDGDFNVGVTSTAELERLVAQKAKDTKVFLSVLGFGRGNLNDAMMQTIADRGNGNHHYVDNLREARKVLVEEMTGTLLTIAKDVKIQVEFNPAQVAAYRLIGYENRMLRTEDFNDDRKDAGEIGAGHTVTALYEVIPAGKRVDLPAVDELKYQRAKQSDAKAINEMPATDTSHEMLTLKMRYKDPEGEVSRKLEWPVIDAGTAFQDASIDFQFASAVASFGLILRGSEHCGDATLDAVAEIAEGALGKDERGYRTEFVELIRRAKSLTPADATRKAE